MSGKSNPTRGPSRSKLTDSNHIPMRSMSRTSGGARNEQKVVRSTSKIINNDEDFDEEFGTAQVSVIEVNNSEEDENVTERIETLKERSTQIITCNIVSIVLLIVVTLCSGFILGIIGTFALKHSGDLPEAVAYMINSNTLTIAHLDQAVPESVRQLYPIIREDMQCMMQQMCVIMSGPVATKLNITINCGALPAAVNASCPIDLSGITFGDSTFIHGNVSASAVNSAILHNSGSSSSPAGFGTQISDLNDRFESPTDVSSPSPYGWGKK